MTFYNNFSNLNIGYFNSGMNNWFTPMFSCFTVPTFFNCNFFGNIFSNFNASFFQPSTMFFGSSSGFGNYSQNNIFDFSSIFNSNDNLSSNSTSMFDSSNVFSKTYLDTSVGDFFTSSSSSKRSSANSVNKNVSKKVSGNINHSYLNLSQANARKKAQNDSNLEELKGGKNWSISEGSFRTDIPFAKKGTSKILDEVARLTGENLVITSALGTGEKGNPHQKGGYASHHNAENPKLDIRTRGNGAQLAKKLKQTGYFSRVSIEKDHLDVQIDPSKFSQA